MMYKVTLDLRIYEWEILQIFRQSLEASKCWACVPDIEDAVDRFRHGDFIEIPISEEPQCQSYVNMHTFTDAILKHIQSNDGSAYLEQVDKYLQINHNYVEEADADQILQLAALGRIVYNSGGGESEKE